MGERRLAALGGILNLLGAAMFLVLNFHSTILLFSHAAAASTEGFEVPSHILVQTGIGYSGNISMAGVGPVEGEGFNISRKATSSEIPALTAVNMFSNMLNIGSHLWLIPRFATSVLRYHKETGVGKEVTSWPSGFTKTTLDTSAFVGAVYASAGGLIWMIPYRHTTLVTLNPVSEGMEKYSLASFSNENAQYKSGFPHGSYLWVVPYLVQSGKNGTLVKVRQADGTMQGFNSYPSNFVPGAAPFYGVVYDGLRYGWLIPRSSSKMVVRLDADSGDLVGYNTWPSQYVGGATGCTFDGRHVWIAPHESNMIVAVDTTTSSAAPMRGYNEWPAGFSRGSKSFYSAIFDGRYVWCLPYQANMLLRLETSTSASRQGTMKGFNKAPEFQFMQVPSFDPATSSLYVLDHEGALNQLNFYTAQIHVSDGLSYNGATTFNMSSVVPLDGPNYHLQGYANWESAFGSNINKTQIGVEFQGTQLVRDDIWMVPLGAQAGLVKLNKHSGVMTHYDSSWPIGLSRPGPYNFVGSVYDGTSIWLIPYKANMLVQVALGPAVTMTGYMSFPSGAATAGRYFGGIYDGRGFLWMTGSEMPHMARVDIRDGSMTGFPWSGAPGYNWGAWNLLGAAFDGVEVWATPLRGSWVVATNTFSGSMRGFNVMSSTSPSVSCGSDQYGVSIYTGYSDLYLLPYMCDAVIQLNTVTGTTTSHKSWPPNVPSYTTGTLVHAGMYDGRYIWMQCLQVSMLIIRFDTQSGNMISLDVQLFPQGYVGGAKACMGVTLDPETYSIWFIPQGANMVLRLTSSPSRTISPEITTTTEGIIRSDGNSYGGIIPHSLVTPLEGSNMTQTTYNNPNKSAGSFGGIIPVDDDMWLLPYISASLIRIHRSNGSSTAYNTWPAGVTLQGSAIHLRPWVSGAYHAATRTLWLVPQTASHLVSFNVDDGATNSCPSTVWPSGFSSGVERFWGCFIEQDQYLWMAPDRANMLVRVTMDTCAMRGHNDWSGYGGTSVVNWRGLVFDGSRYGWMIPSGATTVVQFNVNDGVMSMHNTWPAGFSPGSFKFIGGAFDGQNVWMAPQGANMIVEVDKNTGTMTGYNKWPPNFNPGTVKFQSAAFDGKYVWFPPREASHLIRVEATTGTLVGFKTTGLTCFGLLIDFESKALWVRSDSNDLVKITFRSFIILQDGRSSSGTVDAADVTPLEGPTLSVQEYTHRPSSSSGSGSSSSSSSSSGGGGWNCTSDCFYQGAIGGEYLWLTPKSNNDQVVKIHKHTGLATGYNNWPSALLPIPTSNAFSVVSFDAKRNLVWLVPAAAVLMAKVDAHTGTISECPSWPSGFTGASTTWTFMGGALVDSDELWLSPNGGNMVVQVNLDDCSTLTGHAGFPTGVTVTSYMGALWDGFDYVWLIHASAEEVTKINIHSGTMTGYTDYVAGTHRYRCGGFDGQALWYGPWTAPVILQIDKDTAAMTGHSSYPPGFILGGAGFDSAPYDGKYIWFLPKTANFILRVEKNSGTMVGFSTSSPTSEMPESYQAGSGGVMDFSMNSIWFISRAQVYRLEFRTETQAASVTSTPPSGTSSRTESQSPERHSRSKSSASTESAQLLASDKSSSSENGNGKSSSSKASTLPIGSTEENIDSSKFSTETDIEDHSAASGVPSASASNSDAMESNASSNQSLALLATEEDPAETLNSATVAVVANVLGNKDAAKAVVGTGTASAAVASLGSPTAAGQAVRVAMVLNAIHCGFSASGVAPSVLKYPIQLKLAGETDFALLTGSVLVTTLTFLVAPMLITLFHFCISEHTEDDPLPKWRLAFQGRIMGTLLAIGVSYFGASLIESAVMIGMHGEDAAQRATGVLCALFYLAAYGGGAVFLVKYLHKYVDVKNVGEGKYEYKNHETDTRLWAQTVCTFVDATRDPFRFATRLFFIEELTVTLSLGMLAGIRLPGSSLECSGVAIPMLVICVLHCLFLLVFRPYAAKLEMFFVGLSAVLLLTLTSLAVGVIRATKAGDTELVEALMKALGYVAGVENCVFFAQAAVMGFWAYAVRERKKVNARPVAAPLTAVVTGAPPATAGGGGGAPAAGPPAAAATSAPTPAQAQAPVGGGRGGNSRSAATGLLSTPLLAQGPNSSGSQGGTTSVLMPLRGTPTAPPPVSGNPARTQNPLGLGAATTSASS